MDRQPMRDHRPAPDRTPFQFSLRTLMIIMTAAAVVFSGLFAGSGWLTAITILLLTLAIPIVLTVAIVYGRGYGRTFCVGALFPAGMLLLLAVSGTHLLSFWAGPFSPFLPSSSRADAGRFALTTFLTVDSVVLVMAGLLAMGVRKMVEGPGRRSPRKATLRKEPPVFLGDLPADTERGPYWDCVSCGKTVPVSLDSCWNCDAPRIPEDQPSDRALDGEQA